MGNQWKQCQTIFLGSKIIADGNCSHEIKGRLLLGRKATTNFSSVQFSHSVVSDSLQPHESRYADYPTLIAKSEELKSPLMKVKEESEKIGLKLNFQKTNIMAAGPIASWQIDGETVETVSDYFSGLQNHCRW